MEIVSPTRMAIVSLLVAIEVLIHAKSFIVWGVLYAGMAQLGGGGQSPQCLENMMSR